MDNNFAAEIIGIFWNLEIVQVGEIYEIFLYLLRFLRLHHVFPWRSFKH